MRRRVVSPLSVALGVALCVSLLGVAQFDDPVGFAVEDLQLISLESLPTWSTAWTGPVEAATIVAWLREHGFPGLLNDLNGDGVVDELDTIQLADIFGAGPMQVEALGGTTDALLVQALASHVARAYPGDFELKIYDPGFPQEYQRQFGVPFAPDVVPGILLSVEEAPNYAAYVRELETAEGVIVGLELEEDRNYYLAGRSYLFEPIAEGVYGVDFAWGEEDVFESGTQGQILETRAQQTDGLYVRYEGAWELAEAMLALSPVIEVGGDPHPGPCPEDAIAYDVTESSTPYGRVRIEECVYRVEGLDIYVYYVTNISFERNGCGLCWFGVPNLDGLLTVFQNSTVGWLVNPYLWPIGGWDWRAPAGDCGIEIGETEVFWFAVPGPTIDVYLLGGVGACPGVLRILGGGIVPPPELFRVRTTGPRQGDEVPCPDVSMTIKDWSCVYGDRQYNITIWAEVANIGTVDVGPFTCRASTVYGSDDHPVGGMAAGVTGGIVFHLTVPDPGYAPCVDVTATADVFDDIPGECDEANNVDTQEVCCTGEPGDGCPDPYFSSYYACYYTEQPAPGGPSEWYVKVQLTVRNGGSVTATNVDVLVDADGESSSATIPTLAPGGTWAHTYTLSFGTSPPSFPLLVTAEIDPDDDIDESCYPAPDGEHNNYTSAIVSRNQYCP